MLIIMIMILKTQIGIFSPIIALVLNLIGNSNTNINTNTNTNTYYYKINR